MTVTNGPQGQTAHRGEREGKPRHYEVLRPTLSKQQPECQQCEQLRWRRKRVRHPRIEAFKSWDRTTVRKGEVGRTRAGDNKRTKGETFKQCRRGRPDLRAQLRQRQVERDPDDLAYDFSLAG